MGKRRKMPGDLMKTILNEGSDTAYEERTFSEARPPEEEREATGPPLIGGGSAVSWDEKPERIGATFNLSKQVVARLEALRWELRPEGDSRLSRSEIAEAALRIAIEDVLNRGEQSDLVERLDAHRTEPSPDVCSTKNDETNLDETNSAESNLTTRFSVDEAGLILTTTYNEDGGIVDEDVVGTVSELPVIEEYMDDDGRMVSVAKDELGNTFEQTMDDELNALETRLLPGAG